MKSGLIILSVIVIAVIGAGIGLVFYADNMESPKEEIEVTLPDSSFPK